MYKRELSEREKNFMRSEVESWCCSQKRALWAREDGADPCIGVEVTRVCSPSPVERRPPPYAPCWLERASNGVEAVTCGKTATLPWANFCLSTFVPRWAINR